MIQTKSQIFVIAEYQPIFHQAHIFSIILHPSSVSKKSPAYTTILPTKTKVGRMEEYKSYTGHSELKETGSTS